MSKPFPLHPKHPDRICWGCDRYCAKDDLACGNGSERTMHPMEMFGDDWHQLGDLGVEGPVEANDPKDEASKTPTPSKLTGAG